MPHCTTILDKIIVLLNRPVPIAPLVVFRMLFGAAMLFSVARFWYLGWIEDHFLQAKVTFKYYGFAWVEVLPAPWMYAMYVAMLLGALGIMLGAFYRVSAAVFFLTFSYTELIDLTYYLNHYYFVSLVAFWMIWLPAHRRYSVDVWRKPEIFRTQTPFWTIALLQMHVALVYVYAGLAKINSAWLLEAMPLRLWLPANDTLPLIGPLLQLAWMPWVFSWAGMLYDCTIVGFLLYPPTRLWAYMAVVAFHTITGLLFQIGVFPLVMTLAVLLFFSPEWHERALFFLDKTLRVVGAFFTKKLAPNNQQHAGHSQLARWSTVLLGGYVAFQILFPWRYLLYPGNLFWTEEGYRFSWRVMLMEKAGTATFYVTDGQTGREGVVDNSQFLCAHQEKQMAMQPDMILQYAHFLAKYYAQQGVCCPKVRAEAYVTLNGQPSRLLIDPHTDLTQVQDGWGPKTWITRYEK